MTDPVMIDPLRPANRPKNKLGFGIFVAPLIVVSFLIFLQAPNWHPADDKYSLQGIDVSNHQGVIDWQLLPAQGVNFAFIKATEGGDFVDKSFARNWQAAGEAGIARGAYHFFTLCRPGSDQADNFIATVPVAEDALAPVVDLEYLGNCSQRPKIADFHGELAQFLVKIEKHYGQPAIFYLTEEFDDAYQVTARYDNPLWLRSLVTEPDFGSRDWDIWQVSNFRRLDGIKGRVDWNVMRRDSIED